MGKLIEGVSFGQKKQEKLKHAKSRGGALVSSIADKKQNDSDPSHKNIKKAPSPKTPSVPIISEELINRIINIADKITRYIEGLQIGYISNEVLATAEREWKQKTLDELLSTAEESNEKQWSKYPGRYSELARALIKKI